MNSVRSSALKLGIVGVIIALMATLIWSALKTPVTGALNTYSAELTDVSGMTKGTDVRMSGVLVGKVTGVALDADDNADVTFTVSKDQQVYDNTEVSVLLGGLVGGSYLALQQTKAPGAILAPGSRIPLGRTHGALDIGDLFDAIKPIFHTMTSGDIDKLVQNLQLIAAGDSRGLGPVFDAVDKVISVASDQQPVVDAIADNLNAIVARFHGQAPIIDSMLDQVLGLVDTVYAKFADLRDLLTTGATGLNWLWPVINKIWGMYYDNFAAGDRFYNQVLPTAMVQFIRQTLAAVPAALNTLNGLFLEPKAGQRWACLNGLPVPTTIVMGNQRMEACK